MPAPLIQVSSHGAIRVDADALPASRSEFAERHAVCVPSLVSHLLLRILQDRARRRAVRVHRPRVPGRASSRRCSLWNHLMFLVNDPELFGLIRRMTGCDRSGRSWGACIAAGATGVSTWHTDMEQDRLIGMSINLGTNLFRAARECATRATQRRLRPHERGARRRGLFRTPESRAHGDAGQRRGSRTVLAGWFRARRITYDTMLKPLDLAPRALQSQPRPLPPPPRARHCRSTPWTTTCSCMACPTAPSSVSITSARRIWELVVDRQDVNATLAGSVGE